MILGVMVSDEDERMLVIVFLVTESVYSLQVDFDKRLIERC
ncbi:hypothetical protein Hanom_Chr03g00199701 [Helianthus anomalus]